MAPFLCLLLAMPAHMHLIFSQQTGQQEGGEDHLKLILMIQQTNPHLYPGLHVDRYTEFG